MAEPALTPGPVGGQAPLSFGPAPTGPQFDLIEVLPPAAAEKVRTLRQRSLDLHAVVPPHEQLREASMARINAERELQRLRAPAQDDGFNLPIDNRSVQQAQATLDKATADFDPLTALQQQRASAWQASSLVLSAVETSLKGGRPPGTTLEDIETPEVKLLKGESVTDGILRLQRRVRELKADLHRIESAPFPSSWAKARVREVVDQLAARGAPDVINLIEHGGAVVWPTLRAQAEVHGAQRALAFLEMPDVVGLLAHLLKPTLIAALDALVMAEADDKAALTQTDRELRTAEVMADLMAVEREEAALTWRAVSERLPVEFRADIAVSALLGVTLVTKPNGHQEPTSWMHAWDIRGGN
jgi:hypothetical protein